MDNAVPIDSPPAPASAVSKHGITAGATVAHQPPPSGTPTPEHFLGHPMVGTFFFDGKPLGGPKTYCTGSVVHTAAKDIVLTAGHCGRGLERATHRIFVPQYRIGRSAVEQPSGVYPVSRLYIDPRYEANTKKPTSDLDLAFAQVDPNTRGKVEDVTGALTFTPTSSYHHEVTVIGYPDDVSVNPDHVPVRCPVSTSQLPGFRQMRMTCTGFYGGVSGGPWIEDYNSTNGTGKVIGNTGGYHGGGNDANDDWVTYSPIYGKDAQDLFADAAAHRKVDDNKPSHQPSGELHVEERQDHHGGRLHRVQPVRPAGPLGRRRGDTVRRRRLQRTELGRHPDDQTQRPLEERDADRRGPLRRLEVRHRPHRALGRR
ncbi:trypsin-like serine peptidase [Streptomyces mirabilis]